MYYKYFRIKNYKGIKEVVIDLSNNRILTLVGLNESGKTTILESIHWFYRFIKGYNPSESELNSFRPKGIAFTGDIEFTGCIFLENEDVEKLKNYWKTLNKKKQLEIDNNEFIYTFKFRFDTHKYKEKNEDCFFAVKTKGTKRNLKDIDKDSWQFLVNKIKEEFMPEILFYTDFIFTIPDKIQFIKNPQINREINNPTNKQWQDVLSDILKSVDLRFTSFQEFLADIWDSDNDTATQRLSAMERILNIKITAKWKELFQKSSKKLNFKEIKLSPTTEGNYLNITFKIKTDNNQEFLINERSKGCRWFFSFLIFTEFRKARTKNILFLLDEPASNLHSSAQQKILEAIEELSKGSMVIYTTHSHHLINPKWLFGAYVIINEIIDEDRLEGDITFDEGAKITAEKYFNYVGKGLGKVKISYFQPILDCLDYAPSAVEPIPNIVITEGKNDWYTFKYFDEIIFENEFKFNFYPGAGKDQHWEILRIYLSWGKNFLLILDGDIGGEKSKERYIKEFNDFVKNKIFTLKDVFQKALETEDLIIDKDKKAIIDSVFGDGTYENINNNDLKSKLNLAINHLIINKKQINLSRGTKDNFRKLFEFIKNNLCPPNEKK